MGQEHSLPVGDREPAETVEEHLARCRRNVTEAAKILGINLHEPVKCKWCGVEIFWAQHYVSGRAMPVTAAPIETGTVQLIDRNGSVIARVYDQPPPGTKLRLPHSATCARRAEWPTGESNT